MVTGEWGNRIPWSSRIRLSQRMSRKYQIGRNSAHAQPLELEFSALLGGKRKWKFKWIETIIEGSISLVLIELNWRMWHWMRRLAIGWCVGGGARWPICDSIRLGRSCSCINAPSICSVAGYGRLKTVGSGDVRVFMVRILSVESLLPWRPAIDARFTRRQPPFQDLPNDRRREKL
jgi:hypothetical protein